MDKNLLIGSIYQFVILLAIIAFLGLEFVTTGVFNETLLGALIGVLVSLPIKSGNKY